MSRIVCFVPAWLCLVPARRPWVSAWAKEHRGGRFFCPRKTQAERYATILHLCWCETSPLVPTRRIGQATVGLQGRGFSLLLLLLPRDRRRTSPSPDGS